MYNSSYEDYMENVLGYRLRPPQDTYQMPEEIYEMPRYENASLERFYPEIYNIVHPMVEKVCMTRGSEVINEEMIESMTNEIYTAMVEEETRKQNDIKKTTGEVRGVNVSNTRRVEETRQNNFLLRDLIRILIINELLRRRRPPRPPFGPGPRPPRPGMGPNFPGEPNFPIR